jgi:4'-phosphopantetheinyl transferase
LTAPALKPGTCHTWWARADDAHPRLRALLDADEQQRLVALRRPVDRDRFLVACSLTRLALASYLDLEPAMIRISRTCPTCRRPHGKPRLTPPAPAPIELSVSHSGNRIAVQFAWGTAVGVDIEQLRPDIPVDELTRHVLTAQEAQQLRGLDDAERTAGFLTYWTRKEAVLKALGHGLTVDLRSFGVSGPREPPRLSSWPPRPELRTELSLHDLNPGRGYVGSLAVVGDCRHLVDQDGSTLLSRAAPR